MRTHTNAFKQEISSFGKQISGRLYRYLNYDLITEDGDTLITEDGIKLLSEQINPSDKELIDEELIYSISLVKNGQLLQSLMKELNFEAKYDLKIGKTVNAQFGMLVGNDFEYLDYGDYIVYSKEYIAENQTWQYVCYDKMLYSMVQYEPLNLTYPCTIRDYLIALANKIGLTFANANDEFTNYNEQVLEELFEGQNITYRDILDKLSEITASNILINDNDELELGYPSETNDTINEENLKDVNVNFGETFGPINKVAITETDGGYEYPAEDSQSIEENGLWQVNINDNLFAFNGDSNTIAQNILNKLNGLYYSINDFSTTGVCYYDYLDLFNVSIGEDTYKCLLLNNEINITQGFEENIFTERKENTRTQQNNYATSIINNKQVQFQINKQKNEIEARVEKNGVINAINLSEEGASINAEKISLAGKTIDMTSENIKINSTNFNVDKDGNCIANSFTSNNATITGGSLELLTGKKDTGDTNIKIHNSSDTLLTKIYSDGMQITNNNDDDIGYFTADENIGQFAFNPTATNNSLGGYVDNNDASFSVYMGSAHAYFDISGAHPASDRRCKDNIKNIDKDKSIKIISELNPVEYTYKGQSNFHRGLIAQEVEETLNKNGINKEVYSYDKAKDRYTLNYTELIPDLINCIKYQQEQIETLQKQVQNLERKNK